FFKPNISTMVGQLYKDGDARTDAGFSLFYAGINLGALLGGYICIAVANGELWQKYIPENLRWNYAFGFAAIVMTISLITFIFTKKTLANIGLQPKSISENKTKKWYENLVYAGSLLIIPILIVMVSKTEYTDYFMYTIGPLTIIYLVYEISRLEKIEKQKMYAALVFVFFSIWFWAFFEQSGGSLSLFAAHNLSNKIGSFHLDPNGVNNASNSLFVIAFAGLLGLLWLWLNKRKKEPNSTIKFGMAFLFLAGGFFVFYWLKNLANANGITSLGWFTFGWFIITFGELCLSPIGMSLMTKLSPQKLQGVMMGMWFLASAYGQYVAGILGANIATDSKNKTNLQSLNIYCDGYLQLAIYALIFGTIIIAISPLIKKWMNGVK
ncbi:MAG: oligopeptide:H+ symporter, partial [Bacteroidetes bacterium]|nr:oligopeptide:H+ symporter [Bacteroidota bacterium]